MKKRGQITVFLVIGLVILIMSGLYYYLKGSGIKSVISSPTTIKNDAGIVKSYAESCIKMATEHALFDRIGLQGGFIDPEGSANYREPGVVSSSISPALAEYLSKKVPFYLKAECDEYCATYSGGVCTKRRCRWRYTEFIPDPTVELEIIGRKLANYVEFEFEQCFEENIFNSIGINVEEHSPRPSAHVSFNEMDTYVKLNYNLTVKGAASAQIESFSVTLPIRLKAVYNSTLDLVRNIKEIEETDFSAELDYIIAPDCPQYDTNGLTNVYQRSSEDGSGKIVQFVDFSTYQEYYLNSFIFQAGLKNINIVGACSS
ncbi:hypothetical protein HYX04_05465 [Candidatus Woesearchaeota archaeon]|nr:hypothetical protein [Candidatus Woesearchaeota archaeon]